MPLRKPRRLPRRYNRAVTKQTRKFATRRRKTKAAWKKEKLRRWTRRAARAAVEWRTFFTRWVLVGVFCTLLLVLGLLLFSPRVRIQTIRIPRTDARLDVEQTALQLSSLYGRHLLFLSPYEVESLIGESLPDMQSVSIEKIYPNELRVNVTLAPLIVRLAILAPDEEPVIGTGGTIDFLTEKGIYVQLPGEEEHPDLPLLHIIDWGARPLPGAPLVTPAFVEQLFGAENALVNQFGHQVQKRIVFLRGQEFHLELQNYTLWFDVRSSLDDALQRYRTFLQAVNVQEQVREYIDLRLTDKVVYK